MASIPVQPVDHGISSSSTFPRSPADNLNIYDMGPIDLTNHFIETIVKKRMETLIRQDLEHVPYRVDEVPKEVVHKLESLAHAQDFGVGCFNQLYEALEKAVQETLISNNPEEDFGKGVKGAVAMLAELSLQVRSRVRPDYTVLEDANMIEVHVVLVDGLGEAHTYSHFLHPDADIRSFHEEMDQKFSKYCDPYDEWAYKNWDARVQDLKKTGLDENPALHRIEGLVTLHRALRDKELPQWMHYTILEGGDDQKLDIKDEESFKTMIERAAKKEFPACLMRIREAKFRNIFVELRLLEETQLALARRSQERSRMPDNEDNRHETQQPSEGIPKNDDSGNDDTFFDPEPLGSSHRLTYFYNLDHDNPKYFEGWYHDGIIQQL